MWCFMYMYAVLTSTPSDKVCSFFHPFNAQLDSMISEYASCVIYTLSLSLTHKRAYIMAMQFHLDRSMCSLILLRGTDELGNVFLGQSSPVARLLGRIHYRFAILKHKKPNKCVYSYTAHRFRRHSKYSHRFVCFFDASS